MVTILAAYTKNGGRAELPLPADVANDLARLVATIPSGQPVFALPARGADMLKKDLALPVFLTVIARWSSLRFPFVAVRVRDLGRSSGKFPPRGSSPDAP